MKVWRIVAGVLAAVVIGSGVSPAWACGCGGYMSDVVVRKTYWPFRDLGILGRARGDVGAPAPGGMDVRQQMVLGPFQVARLGGTSATAVTNWLATNGYVVPAGLAANLAPYITEKWEIIAVKLAPKDPKGELDGATPPLRLSFASQRIVYPMRLSKGASLNQTVTVYVAAPYRVDATQLPDPAVTPELLYAGRVQSDPHHEYHELAAPTSYLTVYSAFYSEPERISNDFQFARARPLVTRSSSGSGMSTRTTDC